MDRLSLYLLGAPRFEQDGSLIKVDTRKAIALLVYLAVTGERQRRDTLVNLLWPEYDRERGRTALRRTIYALRKALIGDWMEIDRQAVSLLPEANIWVDVNQFRGHLAQCEQHGHPTTQVCPSCVTPLKNAVCLYRGDFLSGFGLKDSFNFDEWQLNLADLLQNELAGALERLERWHMDQHDYETALGYARRRLLLDPLDEGTHSRLMSLYTWSGQRTSALRQYEACAKTLGDQLGVSPQSSLTEMYEAIKQGRSLPPPESQVHPPLKEDLAAVPVPYPSRQPFLYAQLPRFLKVGKQVEKAVFVAREPELACLQGNLLDVLNGHGRVVFVTGEAGSGKTALLQEFANRAQETNQDLVITWGRCNAHTGYGDPYLPFREILELLSGDVESRWAAGAIDLEEARRLWHLVPLLAQLFLEFGPDLIGSMIPASGLVKRASAFATNETEWFAELRNYVNSEAESRHLRQRKQSAIFEQYTRVVKKLSEQKPLLIILDDLQWADNGSTSLLFHLGRRMEGSRIFIVGAYRQAEVFMRRSDPTLFRSAVVSRSSLYHDEEGFGFHIDREHHPLIPVIHEFKRSFGDIEVDLEQAQSRQFVNAILDTEPNLLGESFRETLLQHTRGYPLFTVELLRGMQDRGDLLRDDQGRWMESDQLNWDLLPARVEAVIAQRISRLPKRLQEILDIACVEGETFTAEVIAEVNDADQKEIIQYLSGLLDREHRLVSAFGFLHKGSQRLSQYRFRHILFQKYLYNRLDVVVRAQLHNDIGLTLEKLYTDQAEQVPVQLARHFEEAGIIEKAVEYLEKAGDKARQVYANEEAQRYYRKALTLLDNWKPDSSQKDLQQHTVAHLHENLGELLILVSEFDDASLAIHNALNCVPPDDLVWQASLKCKLGNLWRLQRCYEEALHYYQQAETILGAKSPQNEYSWWEVWLAIQINRLWAYYWMADWHKMAELTEKVKPIVEQYGSLRHRIDILSASCDMQFRRDRYVITDSILATVQEAVMLSMETGDMDTISYSRFELGFSYLWRGDFEDAETELRAALEGAQRIGDLILQTRCLTYLTILYRMNAKIEQAQDYALQSLEHATAVDMVEYIGSAEANLAWSAWQQGRLTEVEQKAGRALELWSQTALVYPFQWLAIWPLIAVNLENNRIGEAIEYTQVLLEETQMHLKGELEVLLGCAISAWEGNDPENTKVYLYQSTELSDQIGYL